MGWRAIYSLHGQQLRAVAALEALGVPALCPYEKVAGRRLVNRRLGLRKNVVIDVPLFGRYFFADSDDRDELRQCRLVAGVVCNGTGQMLEIPYREMDELLARVGPGGLIYTAETPCQGFEGVVGDLFEFSQGGLVGHRGRIVGLGRLEDHMLVDVEIQIFGRATQTTVPWWSVGSIIREDGPRTASCPA